MIPHDNEAECLRRLVRAAVTGEDARIDADGVDAARLIRLITLHRLPSFLEPAIHREPSIPREIRETVLGEAGRLRMRGALLRLECARLSDGLERAGCSPIVLKGAALAVAHYRDPGDRVFSDVDVLVPRDRVEEACRVAGTLGYAEPRRARAASGLYDLHHFHRVLESQSGLRLEVHWDLTRPGSTVRFDLEGLRARARTVDAEGARWRVLSDVDQFLHAASQSLKEGFADLRRVVDAALLLRAGASSGAGVLEGLARSQGLATSAWFLGELTDAILETSIGEPARTALRPPALVARCLRSTGAPARILGARRRRSGDRQMLRWLCSPGGKEAFGEIRRYVFPTEADVFDEADPPSFAPRGPGRALAVLRRGASAARAIAVQAGRFVAPADR